MIPAEKPNKLAHITSLSLESLEKYSPLMVCPCPSNVPLKMFSASSLPIERHILKVSGSAPREPSAARTVSFTTMSVVRTAFKDAFPLFTCSANQYS